VLMNRRNVLKQVHFASTAWFVLSVGYILVLALRQAGFHWWIIFSLSGYSALIVFLLISLYLFAVYRGVARSEKTEIEHPLTTSIYYSVFYDVSPFLGVLAGGLGVLGVSKVTDYLLVAAYGCFWATFLVWIIVDPAAGLIEMLSSSSREHRRKRLAQAKAMYEEERLAKQCLLAEVQAKEELERVRCGEILRPYAEKLADLVATVETTGEYGEVEAVGIGVNAWQVGGLNCMRQLHSLAMEICSRKYQNAMIIDYITAWWDGVGSWRSQWLGGQVGQS